MLWRSLCIHNGATVDKVIMQKRRWLKREGQKIYGQDRDGEYKNTHVKK